MENLKNIEEAIQDKIIDCINSGVAGRLIIFKPDNKTGADLSVATRGDYKEKPYSLRINSLIIPAGNIKFSKDFLQSELKPDKNSFLVFVCFNEVSQKIDDRIWLIPSLQFADIAEVVKSSDNKKMLRFESSLDAIEKNKFSKFLVNSKDLGKLILYAFKTKGKFDFKEAGIQEKEKVNLENLKEFIVQARQNTYAGNSHSIDNPRLLASDQLEFQKGDYFYRDIYFTGEEKFIGQEIVYQSSVPVWGMSYFGNAIGKIETDFLKESLFKLADKCRFGGECDYEKREFRYKDQGQGDIKDFFGKEEILKEGKNIYKLTYQGGLISTEL